MDTTTAAPTCRFVTFGCKINQYDTQAIRESLVDLGYREVSGDAPTDLVVVNACTVTEHAGSKGVAAVRRFAERYPGARILVTGCLSPEDRDACRTVDGVEFVIGNEEKDQIPALVQGAAPVSPGPRVSDRRRSRSILNLSASRFDGRTRAFIKVHDGCDDFCSYCIIPFVRGKSKSRPIDEVLAEARRFADAGYRELVITGIHLRRYGIDLGEELGVRALMEALQGVDGIDRIRLSSIGEKTFTEEFLDFIASDDTYCPFFHIPLQSGCDSVLRRMRREYSVAEYLDTVARIQDRLPRAVVTTDLMIGFPGETDAEFEASLETCRRARFAFLHVFPYSVRSGTKAAALSDHVSAETKLARVRQARELDATLRAAETARWTGRDARVLVERSDDGIARGLTREGHLVHFEVGPAAFVADAPGELRGREVPVVVRGEASSERRKRTGPVSLSGVWVSEAMVDGKCPAGRS